MKNNFEKACEFVEKKFSYAEITENLQADDDILKQITILNLEDIFDHDFAFLLVNNLTNQSGPIREACAFKISEKIKEYHKLFQQKKIYDKFVNSFIDVNPNVVRYMLNVIKYIDDKKYIFDELLKKIKIFADEVINKPRRGKVEEHIYTKKCFKIYWILETLKYIIINDKNIVFEDGKIRNDFFELIEKLSDFEEYTIREKVAQILLMFDNKEFLGIKEKIKKDDNYFVKRYKW